MFEVRVCCFSNFISAVLPCSSDNVSLHPFPVQLQQNASKVRSNVVATATGFSPRCRGWCQQSPGYYCASRHRALRPTCETHKDKKSRERKKKNCSRWNEPLCLNAVFKQGQENLNIQLRLASSERRSSQRHLNNATKMRLKEDLASISSIKVSYPRRN